MLSAGPRAFLDDDQAFTTMQLSDRFDDRTAPSALLRRWSDVHARARLVSPAAGHHLFVVPHPDDEVLTVGGLIQRVESAGGLVEVLAVTDGGNAYPGAYDHDQLAATRRREQGAALKQLGVDDDRTTAMHLRDGCAEEHHDQVVAQICSLSTAATTIVAPWTHDVHSDHEAVGRAALAAADQLDCALWFSLFWAWHGLAPDDFGDCEMIRIDVDDALMAQKQAALRCHRSQLDPNGVAPMLHAANLEPSTWSAEYFVLPASRNRNRST